MFQRDNGIMTEFTSNLQPVRKHLSINFTTHFVLNLYVYFNNKYSHRKGLVKTVFNAM